MSGTIQLQTSKSSFLLLNDSHNWLELHEQNLTVLAQRPDIFAKIAEYRTRLMEAILTGQPQKAWGASHRHLAFIEEVLLNLTEEQSRMERSMRRMQRI